MADSETRLAGVSEVRPAPAHETNSNTAYIDLESSLPDRVQPPAPLSQDVEFIKQDGMLFAGTHLLVEFWEAENLMDLSTIEGALVQAAQAAGATVLHRYLHPFGPEMGVSGVVVLAESHISIHTWPEQGYAAIDVFMCGECNPADTIPVLEKAFTPGRISVSEHRRGQID